MMLKWAFIFLSFLPLTNLWSKEFKLLEVAVKCKVANDCEKYRDKYNAFISRNFTLETFKEEMKYSLLDDSLKRFNYQLFEGDNGYSLKINLEQKTIVSEIILNSNIDINLSELKKEIKLKEGQFFDDQNVENALDGIKEILKERGFSKINVSPSVVEKDGLVFLNINLDIGVAPVVEEIRIFNEYKKRVPLLERSFYQYKDKVFDSVRFKQSVEKISQELFLQGYFFSSVKPIPFKENNGRLIITIDINFGIAYHFDFNGNIAFGRHQLFEKLKLEIKNNLGSFSLLDLEKTIRESYQDIGLFNTIVSSQQYKGIDKFGMNFSKIYFNIQEGHRIKIQDLEFKGNREIPEKDLIELYNNKSTAIAGRDFLDIQFLKKMNNHIKRFYLEKGYVSIEIVGPKITYDQEKRNAKVSYKVNENNKAIIGQIKLNNIPKDLAEALKEKLLNKEYHPFNVLEFQEDIVRAVNFLRNEGYFYVNITNLDKSDLIIYQRNFTEVIINLDFDLNKKAILKNILITGNLKTRYKVFYREFEMKRGEFITPSKIESLRERLLALGPFSSVEISPFITNRFSNDENHQINLIIKVVEKDSINLLLAPGYRTDIGIKVSSELRFSNLNGMNRDFLIRAQGNQRLDFSNLDSRRRKEEKRLLEFNLKTSLLEPYLFGKKLEFETSASMARKRFRGFDADILKFSTDFSKSFFKFITTSLKYQLEVITQFDATDIEKDERYFRIGSITPGLSFDFRDNKIRPTRGSYFGISWEFANPYFYSMNDEDLEINYNKLVSRNRFYYDINRSWILALSISGGVGKNFATDLKYDKTSGAVLTDSKGNLQTKGFIPSVKVFRLDGVDNVRGFAENEINIIESGLDISEAVVSDTNYFSNIKFENRFFLEENMMLALFFDAGRVSVNSFKPLDLRTSTGLSFKILTPVGSLDFDYGVKLRREYDAKGQRESFGRFHLSIGNF